MSSAPGLPPFSPPPDAARGTRVGPYVLLDELGRGGMGVVYRARHEGLNREVALKLIGGDFQDPRRRRRFQIEAESVARLSHPGIVGVHDVGHLGGRPYLVMDLIEGGSLERRLSEGPLALAEAVAVVAALADALGHAHEHQVLHRDLKPANVLLRRDGRPVLVDFGLAKHVDSQGPTRSGQAMGTPAYASPEQLVGDPLDWTADVYALGATFYALLTGKPPFEADTLLEVVSKACSQDPQPPSLLRPGLDADLETICLKCLEKEPRERYPTVRALAEDLARAQRHEPILARRATRWERLGKWARRNPQAARIAGASLAVGLVAAIGLVTWRSREAVARARSQRAADAREVQARDEARAEALRERHAQARAASEEAWEHLARAGTSTSPADRLGLALRALQAAQSWRDLGEGEAQAQAALFEATLALGRIAIDTEQWALAEQALAEASRLNVDDAQAQTLLEQARASRDAEAETRRREVTQALAWVREGRARRLEGGLSEAVFRLTRYPHPDTVTLLADELDRVSHRLLERQGELLSAVVEPSAAERARGEGRIEGLSRALEQLARKVFQGGPDPDVAPIEAAVRRWLTREGHDPDTTDFAASPLGPAISAGLAPGDQDAIQVVCEALGRIGLEEGAVQALERYVPLETSPSRAVTAGLALARLGTERSLSLLHWAMGRFRSEAFHLRVQQFQESTNTRAAPAQANTLTEHAQRAERNVLLGRLDEAAADYTRALELEPRDVQMLTNRAGLLHQLGRSAEALRDLRRALELDPAHAPSWNNLGRVLVDQGQAQQALEAYARALEQDPRLVQAWENRARLWRRAGRLDQALADFDQALALRGDDPALLADRGLTHAMAGQGQRALADWNRALALDPYHEVALRNRGKLRRELGDLEGALEDLSRAIERAPTSSWAYAQRGRARLELQDAAALEDLQQALRLDPSNFDAHVFLGLYHTQAGRPEDAAAAYEAALRADPRNPQAEAVRRTLDELTTD